LYGLASVYLQNATSNAIMKQNAKING
jgi:hypothetical protein